MLRSCSVMLRSCSMMLWRMCSVKGCSLFPCVVISVPGLKEAPGLANGGKRVTILLIPRVRWSAVPCQGVLYSAGGPAWTGLFPRLAGIGYYALGWKHKCTLAIGGLGNARKERGMSEFEKEAIAG